MIEILILISGIIIFLLLTKKALKNSYGDFLPKDHPNYCNNCGRDKTKCGGHQVSKTKCPKCGKTSTSSSAWIKCSKCGTSYRHSISGLEWLGL